MKDYSQVFNAHPIYIDSLYQSYQKDPDSVDQGWRVFFEGFEFGQNENGRADTLAATSYVTLDDASKEFGVMSIINGFRNRGHLLSTTNPIRQRRDRKPHLDLADYNLTDEDLNKVFKAGIEIGLADATLEDILHHLRLIFCGNIGFEYAHIENRAKRKWLSDRIEKRKIKEDTDDYGLPLETKKRILEKLNGAVVFEKFLNTKYVGQKRFSLEGGESTIPALDSIIEFGASLGAEEFIFGMSHRGRLNVLANILGKTYEQIFNEFEGNMMPEQSFGDGDVKYHLGFSSQVTGQDGKMHHLKLVPNPSHLESVDPVVEGFSRAKADLLYGSDYNKIIPILIHGDAAAAGQGVVYETVQMSQLEGYFTGGTIHFVINNQIGFTTDFDDARSSTYCTAAAGLVQAPVFHVNGDDPEAVVFATRLATEYRMKFNSDVFIDMVCYRRHGHNEGDDPEFTQPEMYDIINNHPNPREIYVKKLAGRGDVELKLSEEQEKNFWNDLQKRLDMVKEKKLPYEYQEPELAWRQLKKHASLEDMLTIPTTGIASERITSLLDALHKLPADFHPLSKITRIYKSKLKLIEEGNIDWGLGELLAYGSLLTEGMNVRMSGQDVKRGTFSHRHAVVYDHENYVAYNRLDHLAEKQGKFMIYNSLLSEFGVLGFEYGYSLASPGHLVLWEAQFGDFTNGAQTIVDQYISAAESKWHRMSGLVMLLPHGYEGQGPEHSSARLERFLQACGDGNMVICNVTTPSNFFHLLRRQMVWNFRKPLIVMSPKSLLRHPKCISPINELSGSTQFRPVIEEELTAAQAKKVKRVIFCSGKIYYDLIDFREKNNVQDITIVRLEQLYPIYKNHLLEIASHYKGASMIWLQEEPANMGAWTFIQNKLPELGLKLISRKTSASPATGYKKLHDENQERIVREAMTL
ncbi:MAG: 2-oxoglutarate dehydrogenase E1 component [Saprospiraceae bacterium]|uniref:oxoglutarate dehydrogenase (succinyl-transferring) n=1 Tax=Candidatus Opimibacter skivensis TaxID=2982028 RepID=A0A9D7SUJ9_9BACT|nr:2-oxoglutarate dehydrogenase E1 component [Candidatus Opimibacter skivensis]